jgi:branched-chain amino acid transport system permease protein
MDWIQPNKGLFAAGAAILLFPWLVPNPYYLNVANIIGLNVMMVVGLNLLIGYAGQISLGHAAFFGLGAYLSGILSVTYGVNPWLSILVASLITALVAVLIGMPTLKLRGHYLVMATLGFNLIVNIIMIQWDSMTGSPSDLPGIPNLAIGSLVFDTDRKMFFLIWGVAFVAILLSLNLVRSRVGRGLTALHGSEVAAACLGVKTETYKVKVFVLSALYASVAGSLYAHYLTFVSPKTFDIFFSVELVTMVIVGGMGSIWGSVFGALFLTPLPNVLHLFDEYKDIFFGLILVVVMVFVPQGIAVAIRQKWFSRSVTEVARRGAEDGARPLTAATIKSAAPGPTPGGMAVSPRLEAPILEVKGISVGFGGVDALSFVSFEVPKGSITALIGPNGAGKTTLINVISGVVQPSTGEVFFAGRRLTRPRPYLMAAIGVTRTFQNIQLFGNMTVLENVMVGLHAQTKNEMISSLFHLPGFRREEQEIEAAAWELLCLFNLESKGRWLASSLSYGEMKRTDIARALISGPAAVLLDEPVAGLNMTETQEVARLIETIRSQGISVLLVEHDMNLVMGISDKIVVLNYGSLIAEGGPEEVQRDEKVLAAYLGGT